MGNQCSTQKEPYFSKSEENEYEKRLKAEKKLRPRPVRNLRNCHELSEIGRGNAQVVKAINSDTKEIFAVKKLRCPMGNTTTLIDVEQEAKILSGLQHENIVTFYDAFYENGYLKIYMECIDGGSIESLFKSYGHLDTKVVANFTRQICKGLEYLHFHKIMHRDIKCANILVNRHGQVKLTDFGCAKEVLSVTRSYYGTMGFMAPEVN
jgi:serine/threonine protein kinase